MFVLLFSSISTATYPLKFETEKQERTYIESQLSLADSHYNSGDYSESYNIIFKLHKLFPLDDYVSLEIFYKSRHMGFYDLADSVVWVLLSSRKFNVYEADYTEYVFARGMFTKYENLKNKLNYVQKMSYPRRQLFFAAIYSFHGYKEKTDSLLENVIETYPTCNEAYLEFIVDPYIWTSWQIPDDNHKGVHYIIDLFEKTNCDRIQCFNALLYRYGCLEELMHTAINELSKHFFNDCSLIQHMITEYYKESGDSDFCIKFIDDFMKENPDTKCVELELFRTKLIENKQ